MDDLQRILNEEFDSAIIGTMNETTFSVYSLTKIIKILVKNHQMDFFEAKEHFEHNMQSLFDNGQCPSFYVDDLHFVNLK
jgi:hypothetical protein